MDGESGPEPIAPLTDEMIKMSKACQHKEEIATDRPEGEMKVIIQSESSISWTVFLSILALIISLIYALA